jgi:hypothetical protein
MALREGMNILNTITEGLPGFALGFSPLACTLSLLELSRLTV